MCSHEECASNTRSRGASKTRVMTISRSDGVVMVSFLLPLPPIALLLSSSLELVQVLVKPVVGLFPEPPVPLGPLGNLLERSRLQAGRPPLPLPAPRDEPGALQHLEVLRDRRQAHLERLRQLGDGSLPRRQSGEDRPARGIRERPEGAVQPFGGLQHSPLHVHNQKVKYPSRRLASNRRLRSVAQIGGSDRSYRLLARSCRFRRSPFVLWATPRRRGRPRRGRPFPRPSRRPYTPTTRRSTRPRASPPASGWTLRRRQPPCGCRMARRCSPTALSSRSRN